MIKLVYNYLQCMLMVVGYNFIYIFSYFQIKYNIIYKQLTNFITGINRNEYLYNVELFDFSKNKIIVTCCDNLNKFDDEYKQIYGVNKNDVIMMVKNNSNKLVKIVHSSDKKFNNYMLINDMSDNIKFITLNKNLCNDKFVKTKYKFISISVTYKDKTYIIDTSNINYYVVGNLIDKHFIKYFMQKYYITIIDDDKYKVEIMDHNFKLFELKQTYSIHLEENNYFLLEFRQSKVRILSN
jgi:hypothetical protein